MDYLSTTPIRGDLWIFRLRGDHRVRSGRLVRADDDGATLVCDGRRLQIPPDAEILGVDPLHFQLNRRSEPCDSAS